MTALGGLDGAVRRTTTTYNSRGMPELVTQYDAATSGNVVDEVKFTYDGWGNTVSSRQDHNSAVDASGSVDDYEVEWLFAKATAGRNTLRRDTMTYPNTDLVEYTYLSSPHDADASRVTRVKYEGTVVAEYSYLGLAQLAGENLAQADARWHTYDTTVSGVTLYGDLDRFNRVIQSRWTGYRVSGTRDFYHVELDYDRNSNIVAAEDHVHTAGAAGTGNGLFDAMYSIDAVNRLTQTKEGNWTGSAIDNPKRDEIWTLTQTGNWDLRKLDLDGDLNYNEAGELQDRGVFNLANELKTRNTNDAGGVEFTLTHDKAGNLTDDGDDYKYEYDAFGRLRKVKNQSNVLVAEYTYNGLGQRIGWHYDVDADGTVESNSDDPWYRFVYDDSWRVIATYRGSDSSPKETFVYHAAGLGAFGGSCYIDSTIIRERDMTNGWAGAADGTLEQRHAYCHNWRGDVSAILTSTGKMVEWVKYSSYGVPFALPVGDTDSDGDWDTTDSSFISDNTKPYDVRRDADLDGDADSADVTHANSIVTGGGYQTLGRGVLTSTGVGNRKAYAGYERDPTFHGAGRHLHHARHRVYDADVGRWTCRDPLGYVDGMSLYAYVQGMAIIAADPMGLLKYKTVADCVNGWFDYITRGRVGKTWACGSQLRSDLNGCCGSLFGSPPSTTAEFLSCVAKAQKAWGACSTATPTTTPPSTPTPPPTAPTFPTLPKTMDCFDACDIIRKLLALLCQKDILNVPAMFNCAKEVDRLFQGCVVCCNANIADTGAHDCATAMWQEFWSSIGWNPEDLVPCPTDIIPQDWPTGPFGRGNAQSVPSSRCCGQAEQ